MKYKCPRYASLSLRIGALIYDTILVCAILFISTALLMMILRRETPFDAHAWLYRGWLVLTGFLFFGYCWTHGGQTLGMKAWNIRLVSDDGNPVSWPQSSLRFATALISLSAFGLGYWWSLFDRQGRCWHDIAAKTLVVRANKTLSQTHQPVESPGKNQ